MIEFENFLFVELPKKAYKVEVGDNLLTHLCLTEKVSYKIQLPSDGFTLFGITDVITISDMQKLLPGKRFSAGKIVDGEPNTWINFEGRYHSNPKLCDCKNAFDSYISLLAASGVQKEIAGETKKFAILKSNAPEWN